MIHVTFDNYEGLGIGDEELFGEYLNILTFIGRLCYIEHLASTSQLCALAS